MTMISRLSYSFSLLIILFLLLSVHSDNLVKFLDNDNEFNAFNDLIHQRFIESINHTDDSGRNNHDEMNIMDNSGSEDTTCKNHLTIRKILE